MIREILSGENSEKPKFHFDVERNEQDGKIKKIICKHYWPEMLRDAIMDGELDLIAQSDGDRIYDLKSLLKESGWNIPKITIDGYRLVIESPGI